MLRISHRTNRILPNSVHKPTTHTRGRASSSIWNGMLSFQLSQSRFSPQTAVNSTTVGSLNPVMQDRQLNNNGSDTPQNTDLRDFGKAEILDDGAESGRNARKCDSLVASAVGISLAAMRPIIDVRSLMGNKHHDGGSRIF